MLSGSASVDFLGAESGLPSGDAFDLESGLSTSEESFDSFVRVSGTVSGSGSVDSFSPELRLPFGDIFGGESGSSSGLEFNGCFSLLAGSALPVACLPGELLSTSVFEADLTNALSSSGSLADKVSSRYTSSFRSGDIIKVFSCHSESVFGKLWPRSETTKKNTHKNREHVQILKCKL